jgi:tetratricopeptide (TPR) repeat protein
MRHLGWRGYLILALLACWFVPGRVAAMAEGPSVSRLVSAQGQVAVRRSGSTEWEPAQVNQLLFAGDAVRTGLNSMAAILCIDETQLKLNEKSMVILKSIAPSPRLHPVAPVKEQPPPASYYEVPEGEIWLRNKHEKFRFELDTPAVTATIRGTELNIRVQGNGATSVILLEGNVCLTNPHGEVCLRPGEEGYTARGQKPTKRLLVQPADTVQWVLYYPGVFSYRDLPLASLPPESRTPAGAPAAAALVQKGEAAYDQGRLDLSRQDAEATLRLAPDNSRALTLMGWISLQKEAPEEALSYFRRAHRPDDLTIVGLALSRYRLGDVTGAYEYIRPSCQKPGSTPMLATMCGYFALMAGKADEARSRLEAVPSSSPAASLAQTLLSQIYLVQNRKGAALRAAETALARAPRSPAALLSCALVKMASFDLRTATHYLDKAIQADPGFVPAYVYLAKIWLGSEYLGRARKTIDQALSLAPRDPQVLSLAGFVHLAYRDYRGAFPLWERALKSDPRFGEPHLGLAIYHFRYREFSRGLEEMLTATLLDPRVSSYQTEMGKALFQTRSFDRALEVYDYAKTLDPNDPTPYYYKGIALSDLNRPGEAIQEINKSIELNDNVAIFRSRNLLDQDRAVRNYSLARAYQQLGLTDWALSKAVTAVKYYPSNSSAHLFLRDVIQAGQTGSEASFLTAGLLSPAADIESTLFRVLSPANQAAFSSFQFVGTEALGLTHDYTPMYEMPYVRLGVMGGVGASEGSKSRQDYQAFAYGGVPGAAFETFGIFQDERGLPRPSDVSLRSFNGTQRFYGGEAVAKWDPTVQGTLTGNFNYQADKVSQNPVPSPVAGFPGEFSVANLRQTLYEVAYYYRFNPQSAFLAYFAHKTIPAHVSTRFFDLPVTTQLLVNSTADQESNNVQLQKHLALSFLGQHNLIGGFDYFSSGLNQRTRADLSFVGDGGLFKSFQKDPVGDQQTIYNSMWSPRFGANYQFSLGGTQHVLRAMAERHLTNHLRSQPLLVPSEIASFPWAIDAQSGAEVRQVGTAWEAQWDSKTFTALRLNAMRVATPTFDPENFTIPITQNWKRYQASLVLNRILTTSLGLSVGVMGKRVIPDLSYEASDGLQSYSEFNAFIGLAYMNRQGWLGRIKPLLIQQFGKIPGHEADNPFVIMNLTLGREFPNKWGFALFEVQNLFNRQIFYSVEPRRLLEFPNERRFLFRLGLYF